MLHRRGQLLRAAVGFAGCSMPSYDRGLWRIWRARARQREASAHRGGHAM